MKARLESSVIFSDVVKHLKRIGAAIDGLNKSCVAIRSHITAASRETGPTLEETTELMKQRQQNETKQELLSAFTKHFLLSDDEISSLTSTAEPVTDLFFQALARVKSIHDDSQVLLGSEDQQLGLEILEQSSKQLNAAFQKLFRWTQKELRTLDLEDPQLSIAVRRALRALAERPTLFQSCLDFFAENREHVLSDAFYGALTGGSSQSGVAGPGLGKAIELSAHDPLRYVSDMLAWAHAATVGEREALHILFISDADEISKSIKAGREREPWLRDQDGEDTTAAFDGKKALNELVNRDLSGVLRQLRQRVEQLVHSHEDAMLAYQISNLITFYCSIFSSLLGTESSIVQTLEPITEKAFEQFRTITRDHIANIRGTDVAATPSDLSPPEFLIEALQTLKGLMKSYDTSLGNSSSEGVMDFQPVLEEALDPYLAGCDNITKQMSAPQGQILEINCLLAAKSVLSGSAFTAARLTGIEESIREQGEHLVQAVHGWFVAESGLGPLMEGLEPYMNASLAGQEQEIRQLTVLQPERLAAMARQLDGFLPAAMEDARAYVGQLDDRRLIRTVCEQAADLFVEQYEHVEALLTALDEMEMKGREPSDESDEEEALLRDLFPRTSDELKVLLS